MPALTRAGVVLLATALLAPAYAVGQWMQLGPEGGDVRALEYDPRNPDRIFLGTSAGRLYVSSDGGSSWVPFAHLDGDHMVLDNIALDPSDSRVMYVATWNADHEGGELFRSRDGGRSWQPLPGMRGKSIRAMAVAKSNSKILIAGDLSGVWRSRDGGDSWERISPAGHPDIKNIESIAIDPRNPDVIYAGTWHLPWKTEDGGRTWKHIKQGVIDDSDVFSIIVDHENSGVVYASACSGIYKSENGGALFRKIQGIPSSARRTRVLMQDHQNPSIVYAGTTEGLWRTSDAGRTWSRVTGTNVVVNDVLVDPRNPSRILLATDRQGVLASSDAGRSFSASNHGFSHRQVSTLIVDRKDQNTYYAGVLNHREFGGVFVSRDGGNRWMQMSSGLEGRDVFVLRQAQDGSLLAGTNRGILRWDGGRWAPSNTVIRTRHVATKQVVTKGKKKTVVAASKPVVEQSQLSARVAQLELGARKWFAATTAGLYSSDDQGRTWQGGPVNGQRELTSVRSDGDLVMVSTYRDVMLSNDGGNSFQKTPLPAYFSVIREIAIDGQSNLWLVTPEGTFRSRDRGMRWEHVTAGNKKIASIAYEADAHRLWASVAGSTEVFYSPDSGNSWRSAGSTGYPVRGLTPTRRRLLANSTFHGVLAGPEVGETRVGGGDMH